MYSIIKPELNQAYYYPTFVRELTINPGLMKCIIVEDEFITAMDFKARIEKVGMEVIATCRTGEVAICVCESDPPDLAIIDIQLSGKKDGLDTAVAIQKSQNIPVLFITGRTHEFLGDPRNKAIKHYLYLSKPYDQARFNEFLLHIIANIRFKLELAWCDG